MFENVGRFFKRLKGKSNTFIPARSSGEFVLQKNDFGTVSTEIFAIQRIVERAAVSVEGIIDANCTIDNPAPNSALKIRYNLKLAENFSVNDVSRNLVEAVQKVLEEIFAIIDVEIYVRVTEVSKPAEPKKRRVR